MRNPLSSAHIYLGRPVEITADERRELHERAIAMQAATEDHRPGWFMKYVRAHSGAHHVLRKIYQRSHEQAERVE